VANPYARHLTFLDDRTRTRRDHTKYLTLIDTIALLHQYQRPIQTIDRNGKRISYIEVTLEDIAVANRLVHEVLGRTLDELPPQTRRLLLLMDQMVSESCKRLKRDRSDYRFSRRDIREYTGWSYDQVRVHLDRLIELEYVLVHRGGRGQSFVYELLYDGKGQDGKPHLCGLIDVEALKHTTTTPTLGSNDTEFGVSLGAHTGAIVPLLGSGQDSEKPKDDAALAQTQAQAAQNTSRGPENTTPSYVPIDHTDTLVAHPVTRIP
jgi:hypothetical protein